MNDDELVGSLQQSLGRRVRTLMPRPNVEELLTRFERGAVRQRRVLAGTLVVALLVGGCAGYVIAASSNGGSPAPNVSTFGAGVAGSSASGPSFEPRDANVARAAVASAFHAAFGGGVPSRTQDAATQGARSLLAPRRDAVQFALNHGYTKEQLAGITISILDTSFIDVTHAVVRFSLTIPGHGDVLADRVGYAIRERGRWRVALRTSCDILSTTGLWRQCPPTS